MQLLAGDAIEPHQEAIQRYGDKGWVVIEEVFQAEEMDRIAELALAVCKQEEDVRIGYTVDENPDGTLLPRKINSAFWKSQAFQDLVLDPRMLHLIQRFIGGKPLLFADQVFMKPPRFGSPKPYHQDNAYFLCTPPTR